MTTDEPYAGAVPDDVDEMKRAHEVRQELLAAEARRREREVHTAVERKLAERAAFNRELGKWEPPPD